MTARPCLACGDLITAGTRCSSCTPADTKKPRQIAHAGTDSQWRRLSLRARRMQPFCIDCHTDQDLTADHILPVDQFPELAYAMENITVRCRPHNSARGNRYTRAEAEQVLNALLSAQARRPSPRLRKLIPVAQRAAQVGTRPPEQHEHPGGKAQGPLYTRSQLEPGPDARCDEQSTTVEVRDLQYPAVDDSELVVGAVGIAGVVGKFNDESVLGSLHTGSLP